jgi:DNA-directed RNA polymerase subunit K/omega
MIPEKIKEDLGLEDEYGGDEKKPNSERITSPFISKYEKAIVIGKRAKQISKNSPIFIDITEDELKKSTAIHIA